MCFLTSFSFFLTFSHFFSLFVSNCYQAYTKDISAHRASMIMFAACFFYFGVQRVVLALMTPLHSGPWAKYTPFGPWKEWGSLQHDQLFGVGTAIAFPLTFGIAAYKAYVVPTLPKPKVV